MTKLLLITVLLTSLTFSLSSEARKGRMGGKKNGKNSEEHQKMRKERKAERQEFRKKMFECEKIIFAAKEKEVNSETDNPEDDKSGFQAEMKAGQACRRGVQAEFLQKRIVNAKENIIKMEKKLTELKSEKSEK